MFLVFNRVVLSLSSSSSFEREPVEVVVLVAAAEVGVLEGGAGSHPHFGIKLQKRLKVKKIRLDAILSCVFSAFD
jgi:hypothetical protein